MKRIEYHTKDKSKWGVGPWQSEPDKVQWKDEATGLPCLIVRGPVGALCGYVGVQSSHPLHGKGYSECTRTPPCEESWCEHYLALSAHGGITFAGGCSHGDKATGICHIPGLGEPDNVWWFGFDCAHCDDWTPELTAHGMSEDYLKHCGEHAPMPWGGTREYRDLAYVTAEVQSLARQLRDLA